MGIYVKAPLVLKLFGEHAVVYGYRAIACAVDRYVHCRIESHSNDEILVDTNFGTFTLREIPKPESAGRLRYVVSVLKIVQEVYGVHPRRIRIVLRSDVQPSCGLGTSAGVVSSLMYGLLQYYNISVTVHELAELAYRAELMAQGRASRMDTYTSTLGGVTLINDPPNSVRKLDIYNIDAKFTVLLVRRRRTTRELVNEVYELKRKYPDIVENIFRAIDSIVGKALSYIISNRFDCIGELMYMNHFLLMILGVTNPLLDQTILKARQIGIPGAKVSGAGDGGAVLFLSEQLPEDFKRWLQESWRNDLITLETVTIDNHGIRREDRATD